MIKEFGAGAGAEAGPFPIGRAKEVLKKSAALRVNHE